MSRGWQQRVSEANLAEGGTRLLFAQTGGRSRDLPLYYRLEARLVASPSSSGRSRKCATTSMGACAVHSLEPLSSRRSSPTDQSESSPPSCATRHFNGWPLYGSHSAGSSKLT